MIDSLIAAEIEEKSTQETALSEVMSKLNHFQMFKEGCETEIEYYKDIYEEFNEKIKLGIKYQELENYVTQDLLGITARVNKIDETFKKFD